MRVLVTGGAGFIGSHVAEALLARGDDVHIVDDLSTGSLGNVPEGATFERASIIDPACLGGEPELIVHAAASYADKSAWERDAATNVLGTINVVRLAERVGAPIVYFQTSLCYGLRPRTPVRLDAPLAPAGSYAVSKTAGERYIADSGVPYLSLRLANITGARNLSGPPPQFFKRLAAGEPCVAVDTRRDFVHVSDLVRLVLDATDRGATGVYHVASGTDVAIADVCRAVAAEMGVDDPVIEHRPRGEDDAETILLDPERTYRDLGWRPETSFADAIADAVGWYRLHGVRRTYTHLALKG